MNKIFFQLIACMMLLCTVSLKAAEQMDASHAEDGYDCGLSAITVDIILWHEAAPAGLTAETKATHGQPLPGVMLTVLLASAVMKGLASLRRKAKELQRLLAMTVSRGVNKVISFYHYFTSFESTYVCCWEWQRAVLRL